MAQLNEILGVAARLQQRLTRAFMITGGAPSPQITPEITPVLEMGNMPVEDRWISGERIWSYQRTIAATAATCAEILIRNPADSGMLLIVRALVIDGSGVGNTFSIFPGNFTDLANVLLGLNSPRDTRLGTSKSSAIVSYDNLGAGGVITGAEYVAILQSTPYISFPYVISPGYGLYAAAQNINRAALMGFEWRERPASLGELQL